MDPNSNQPTPDTATDTPLVAPSHPTVAPPVTPADAAPAVTPASSPATSVPGTGLSIAGFIASLIALLINVFTLGVAAAISLTLSIIGRVQTKKSGSPSGLALAGIIISSVSIVLTAGLFVMTVWGVLTLSNKCQELGPGTHDYAGATIQCDADSRLIAD